MRRLDGAWLASELPLLSYTLTLTPLYPAPYTPLQMHVYLIDKFSLYNLKMVNIYGRNM